MAKAVARGSSWARYGLVVVGGARPSLFLSRYALPPRILGPIAAQAQGYYSDLCLRVRFEAGSGDPTSSAQLVDAGGVTVTELGPPADAITDVAGTPSIPVDAIAT
ncbi:MAG: hypothetical protein M0Z42_08860 [Actinomycetota bacterium]|nr:hypothetical protein [Actinomycetota bacterium]